MLVKCLILLLKYDLISTFTNYPFQMSNPGMQTNCASEISSSHIPTQTTRQPCVNSCLSLIVSPSLLDSVRQSTTVLSQENIKLPPSSVSIKPLTSCERSKPMPQYSSSSSKYPFQHFSPDTLPSLTRSLSSSGYSVYNLDFIVEVDEPLFFVCFCRCSFNSCNSSSFVASPGAGDFVKLLRHHPTCLHTSVISVFRRIQ